MACRQLGFDTGDLVRTGDYIFWEHPYLLSAVHCQDTDATSLNQCTYNFDASSCATTQRATTSAAGPPCSTAGVRAARLGGAGAGRACWAARGVTTCSRSREAHAAPMHAKPFPFPDLQISNGALRC